MALPYELKEQSQAQRDALEARANKKIDAVASGHIYPIPQTGNTPANEPAPTKDGIYRVKTIGATYTNFGNIVVPNTTGFIYDIQVSGIDTTPVYTLVSTDVNITTSNTPTEGGTTPFSDGGAFTEFAKKVDKTVVDPIKEKTDNLDTTNDGILYITDNNGKIIAKINSDGINTTKYNLCDTSGNVIGTFDSSLLNTIGEKVDSSDYNEAIGIEPQDWRDALGVGSNNGIASLDNTGKVPSSQLPDLGSSEVDAINEKIANITKTDDNFGIIDASGNVVFLIDNSGVKSKEYHICDVNGNITGTINKSLYDQIVAKLAEANGGSENIIDDDTYKNALVAIDANGKVGLKYDADGFDVGKLSEHFKSLLPEVAGGEVNVENIIDNDTYKNALIVIDALGKIGLKYDSNGFDVAKLSDHFKSLLPNTGGSIELESNFEGDYMMHIVYGQSLAVGGSTISAENVYTAKMFTNGLSVGHSYTNVAEANDEAIQEARFGGITDMSASGGFNNSRMVTKIINELITSENNKELESFNYNQFGLTAGESGAPWYKLTKWNEPRTGQFVDVQPNAMPVALAFGTNGEGKNYLNLVQAIYFANKFAKSQGKKLIVGTLSYIQGEASNDKENTVTQYKAKLNSLFDDISADVTTITGQSKPIQFLTYQNASFALYNEPTRPEWGGAPVYTEGVPLAHLEVAQEREDTHLGTPFYPYSRTVATTGDLIHLNNQGYAIISFLLGIKAKRVVNDEDPLPTFYPITNKIEFWQSGSDWFVYIPFDVPVKPLVFDVEGISGVNMRGHGLQTNYGFEILNNSDADIITNVRLSNDNAIVLTTNENPVGLDLTYALTGAMGGGNLRDSQGDKITAQFNTITYRCDNWCPFFRITL
jgi:hypothetical protein